MRQINITFSFCLTELLIWSQSRLGQFLDGESLGIAKAGFYRPVDVFPVGQLTVPKH